MALELIESRGQSFPDENGKVRTRPLPRERYVFVQGQKARVLPRYRKRKHNNPEKRGTRNAVPRNREPVDAPVETGSQAEEEEEAEAEMKPLINLVEADLDDRCFYPTSGEWQTTTPPPEVETDDRRILTSDDRRSTTPSKTSENQDDEEPKEHENICRLTNERNARTADELRATKQSDSADNRWRFPAITADGVSSAEQAVVCPNNSESDADKVGLQRREKCFSCLRHFVAFLFSTVGSCCLLVGYTILGGFLFQFLESWFEIEMKEDMRQTRRRYVKMLWNVTENLNVLYELNWTVEADAILENFTKDVFQATKKKGWDGTDREMELQWSFSGALLYSITVVTTIGYGHIAPKTNWGKVVTILYAIFGIPLTLFTITNLGSIMATAFRFLYRYICCGLCCACCPDRGSHNQRRRHGRHPRRRRRKSRRRCPSRTATSMITTTTTTTTSMMMLGVESDVAQLTGDLSSDGDGGSRQEDVEAGRVRRGRGRTRIREDGTGTGTGTDGEGEENGSSRSVRRLMQKMLHSPNDINKVSVPIYVSLLLMLGYIGLGTLVFRLSEDWDPLICLYFCFITLSTIGFGDYVPGTLDKIGSEEKMVLCALYLVFGLALIAMCFDLIQEEAKNKVRRLGRRLGLLKKIES